MEGMKLRRASYLHANIIQPELEIVFVEGVGFAVGKDLSKEGLAIGIDTIGGSFGLHLACKRETQMFFKVPCQLLLFRFRERVTDGNGKLLPMLKAEDCVWTALLSSMFANAYHCHANTSLLILLRSVYFFIQRSLLSCFAALSISLPLALDPSRSLP